MKHISALGVLIAVLVGGDLLMAQSSPVAVPGSASAGIQGRAEPASAYSVRLLPDRRVTGRPATLRDSLQVADMQIYRRLESTSRIGSGEMTLLDLCDRMKQGGFPVYINRESLDDEGIDIEVELIVPEAAPNLRKQLELMLAQTDLTYRLCDGVLEILTMIEDEDRLVTVTFDVTALGVHPDELINAIETVIDPLSWENSGGPAGALVHDIKVNGRLLLSVRNRSSLLFQVRQYLENLTALGQIPEGARVVPSTPAPAPRIQPFSGGSGLFNLSPNHPSQQLHLPIR